MIMNRGCSLYVIIVHLVRPCSTSHACTKVKGLVFLPLSWNRTEIKMILCYFSNEFKIISLGAKCYLKKKKKKAVVPLV